MTEYQYYEFRAIDRPLTPDEMSAVGRLSSRVDLSPQHAKFIYNYSDLPARADELLAKYKVEPRTHCLKGDCSALEGFSLL